MPSRGLIRSFVVLWWALGISLLVLSVRTLLVALQAFHAGDPHGLHLALIGGIEAAGALLFLVPPTLRVGAAGPLFAITIAWLAHLHDQFRWDLLIYAAAVLFVAVHGPLTSAQWRHALPRLRAD